MKNIKNSSNDVLLVNGVVIKILSKIAFCLLALCSLEWVFLVTKPSYLSSFNPLEKIWVLICSWLLLFLLTIVIGLPIYLIQRFVNLVVKIGSGTCFFAAYFGLISTATILLFLDNFTYTLFTFSSIEVPVWGRAIYAVSLFGIFLKITFDQMLLRDYQNGHALKKSVKLIGLGVLISFIVFLAGLGQVYLSGSEKLAVTSVKAKYTPNIILIGLDGVSAHRTSLYGSTRDTTPFLKEFSKKCTLVKNVYTNSGRTSSSLASVLTSKYPTTLKIINRPHILTGANSHETVPFILKKMGYRNYQITQREWADAYDINMKSSFDSANGQKARFAFLDALEISPLIQGGVYFLRALELKLNTRLQHICFLKKAENPYIAIKRSFSGTANDDKNREKMFNEILETSKIPFFIHIHFLAPHGPKFKPYNRVFSKNKKQSKSWMNDFYDDTLLDFDNFFKGLIAKLEDKKQIDNTIIIFFSDHGMKHSTASEVPLMFYFPGKEGRVVDNKTTELIDIFPTIFDVLGLDRAPWMEGESIFKKTKDYAIAVGPIKTKFNQKGYNKDLNNHLIDYVDLITQNKVYRYSMKKKKMDSWVKSGKKKLVNQDQVLSKTKALQILDKHLRSRGYVNY